jgi:CubicO group peptidase (beta-lactamase class C family)
MNVEGSADARFAPVRDCFAEVLGAQAGTGAAFAAWCDGQLVVDLWGGHADLGRRRLRDARTLA